MSAIVHLVATTGDAKRVSACGREVCVLGTRADRGFARGTLRREQATCRACLAAILPGSHGGTANDPDSIDVEQARNAVDHYTRKLAEPRTITRG